MTFLPLGSKDTIEVIVLLGVALGLADSRDELSNFPQKRTAQIVGTGGRFWLVRAGQCQGSRFSGRPKQLPERLAGVLWQVRGQVPASQGQFHVQGLQCPKRAVAGNSEQP